jgi:putative ABC transport system permease protein
MTAAVSLLRRLILRPLRSDPLHSFVSLFSVALGVAVVVAIRLAGDAAAGSFRSSMESLQGEATLEIASPGGLDERYLGNLVELPYPLEFSPRINASARFVATGRTIPLFGVDLVHNLNTRAANGGEINIASSVDFSEVMLCSEALACSVDEAVSLIINDRKHSYRVAGTVPGIDPFVVLDISEAQAATRRAGRLDVIQVTTPPDSTVDWTPLLRTVLPAAAEVRPVGAESDANRKMLTAFRWNLRVLSYIALVVGAFLIYNTIAVSVARRHAEIGVLRALGATKRQTMFLFLCQALIFGAAGTLIGIPLGRLLASGAVKSLGATVQSLYVSSTPGSIDLTAWVLVEAVLLGIAMAMVAAWAPAREAANVAPVEAMARGRREYRSRVHARRNLALGIAIALIAWWAALQPPIDGRPLLGYAASFLLILAMALCTPALVQAFVVVIVSLFRASFFQRFLGVESVLAARSVRGSLSRTAVLTAAMATAVAMMVSVGIMVGSFRETVAQWMNDQLRADLYIRPVSSGGPGVYPTVEPAVPEILKQLTAVEAVDQLRLYEIRYQGMPVVFGGADISVARQHGRLQFIRGARGEILGKLLTGNYGVVSEPFANKYQVREGDHLTLAVGGAELTIEVAGVYRDYASERGTIITDRSTMLRVLPDPAPSNIAVYLKSGVDLSAAREQVESALSGHEVFISTNRTLREEGLRVFDRTFAITWALEAVAILIAVLGVAGALLAMVMDRRRELGLLRFLGASSSQVRRMILCEAGILGLFGNVLGFALGGLLSLILIYVINVQSFGWTIQFHWPSKLLLFALTGIWIATIFAGVWPARMAVRLKAIEVVHEE